VSTFSILMSLVYNMILILLCTVYAVKTRNIPGRRLQRPSSLLG
jgi:metabotropic glutamate receptor 6/7/8